MLYDFNNYKKDAIERPSSKAWSNWAQFKAIGDKVSGYIRDVFYRKSETVNGTEFKESRGITLEQVDGTLINVAIKRLDFILEKTDNLRLGDPLTIVFESEGKKVPGRHPSKIHGFYGRNLPENAGNKTVAELDAADQASGGFSGASREEKKDDPNAKFDVPMNEVQGSTATPVADMIP